MPNTKEYIQIIENEGFFKGRSQRPLKQNNNNKNIKNNSLIDDKSNIELVIKKRGKYNSGTWIHIELFLKFASWVSVRFEYDMHQLIKHLIQHADHVKQDRASTKHLFHPLTDIIKDIYIPAQNDNGKKFAYTNLANLINKKVIGTTAKKYKKTHHIDPDDPIRDTFSDDILKEIEEAEKDMHGYIKYREVTEYGELKKLML